MKIRNKIFEILLASSLPLTLITGYFWNNNIRINNGSAFGGEINNGKYFILSDLNKLINVEPSIWINNFILGMLSFVFGLMLCICIFYFPIKYYFMKTKSKNVI